MRILQKDTQTTKALLRMRLTETPLPSHLCGRIGYPQILTSHGQKCGEPKHTQLAVHTAACVQWRSAFFIYNNDEAV